MLNARIGQQWGSYRLTRSLGCGTFADVYLGKHVHLDMQAAVKILRTSLYDQTASSFQLEAQVIASLLHPHIVRLLDFAIQDGQPFLVLEYAPSGSLSQKHPRGTKLPLSLVVDYTGQVAGALQYAHEKKLVHRDVKPENMLIGRQGAILLSDFGIATIAHSTSSMALQNIQGTPVYMAPEQIQGHPRAASDQYALGIAVYQWLTGSAPFQGSWREVITQHLAMTPRSLHEYVPQIPEEVEHVIQTALAKEPRARFDTVLAFANALQQAARSLQPATGSALARTSWPSLLAPAVQATSASAVQDGPLTPQPEDTPASQDSPRFEDPAEPKNSSTVSAKEQCTATMPTEVLLASPDPSQQALAAKKPVTEPLADGAKPALRVKARGVLLILFTAILALLVIGGATLLADPAASNTLRGAYPGSGSGGPVQTATGMASHSTPTVGANQSTPTATSTAGSNASSSSSSTSSTPASQPTSAPASQPTPPPVPDCLRASPAGITVTQVLGASASLPGSTVTLTNCSPVSGHWMAAVQYNSSSGWTSCNPASGTISANSSQTIHLVTGSPKVLVGTYTASWTFSMGNASSTVGVTLVVIA